MTKTSLYDCTPKEVSLAHLSKILHLSFLLLRFFFLILLFIYVWYTFLEVTKKTSVLSSFRCLFRSLLFDFSFSSYYFPLNNKNEHMSTSKKWGKKKVCIKKGKWEVKRTNFDSDTIHVRSTSYVEWFIFWTQGEKLKENNSSSITFRAVINEKESVDSFPLCNLLFRMQWNGVMSPKRTSYFPYTLTHW